MIWQWRNCPSAKCITTIDSIEILNINNWIQQKESRHIEGYHTQETTLAQLASRAKALAVLIAAGAVLVVQYKPIHYWFLKQHLHSIISLKIEGKSRKQKNSSKYTKLITFYVQYVYLLLQKTKQDSRHEYSSTGIFTNTKYKTKGKKLPRAKIIIYAH